MIVGMAVCPGAPLLVPGLAPALAGSLPELGRACRAAVQSLAGADRLLLVAGGPWVRDAAAGPTRPEVFGPGTAVSAASLSRSRAPDAFRTVLPGVAPSAADRNGGPQPGIGMVVGAALIDAAGITAPTTGVQLPALRNSMSPVDEQVVERVLRAASDSTDRVGLLMIGEGSASRGADSPGGGDVRAGRFDEELLAAMAAADPHRLAALLESTPRPDELLFTAGPVFQALTRLVGARPPSESAVLFSGAPLGVGYLVVVWSWL